MRKTKIICTLGPATDRGDILSKLVKNGMNVARFNFSHGDYTIHKNRFEQLTIVSEKLKLPVATLLDTKGPEVRLGLFRDNKPVTVNKGSEYILTTEDVVCDEKRASVSYKGITEDVTEGAKILINDGLVSLVAEKVTKTDILCRVLEGGVLSNRKGVNIPDVKLSLPYLSEQDMEDLRFGAEMDFDFIAASFVRNGGDIECLRKYISSLGWNTPQIIAKIENAEGVNNIDEILSAADGIMIARGDMGVEIPFQEIPSIQKDIIRKCRIEGKAVITATQMLDSMIYNPVPTRAEITDVANAIYDGTSAVMLSGETAAGEHPVEALCAMSTISEATENHIDYVRQFNIFDGKKDDITGAISHATVTTAHDLGAKAIITVTKSGNTAKSVSRHRPSSMIIGCTTNKKIWRQINLSWGIVPVLCNEMYNTDGLFAHAVEVSKKNGLVKKGDLAVITAGIPLGVPGTTNMLKVERI